MHEFLEYLATKVSDNVFEKMDSTMLIELTDMELLELAKETGSQIALSVASEILGLGKNPYKLATELELDESSYQNSTANVSDLIVGNTVANRAVEKMKEILRR